MHTSIGDSNSPKMFTMKKFAKSFGQTKLDYQFGSLCIIKKHLIIERHSAIKSFGDFSIRLELFSCLDFQISYELLTPIRFKPVGDSSNHSKRLGMP